MLAIKVILGLCMALHVLAETEKVKDIRALSNDQVINAIKLNDTNFRIFYTAVGILKMPVVEIKYYKYLKISEI